LTATAEAAAASFGTMLRRLPNLLGQAWRLSFTLHRGQTPVPYANLFTLQASAYQTD
jgi:hypothetical protein